MRHLLDKHILIVNALDTILGSFVGLGTSGVMPFFGKAPLAAAKGAQGRRVRY